MAGPLEGVVVLDMTRALAGPYGTLLLADLGAEVIKVEPPERDGTRTQPPYFVEGTSAYFLAINRNKECVTLDLRKDEDKQRLWALVDKADMVVENFRPGVMDRLGFGWEALRARKPSIVLASISGYGQDGPYRNRPAFDAVVQAWSGGMSMTGHPGGRVSRAGVPIGDVCAGMTAAMAALAGLVRARTTGQGSHVDVAMLDVQISLCSYQAAYYLLAGAIAGPQGTGQMGTPTYRALLCGDGKEVMVCANTEEMWRSLAKAMGVPELIEDPRFAQKVDRLAHKDELWAILDPLFLAKPSVEIRQILEKADIPVAPINNMGEALENEHVQARGLVSQVKAPSGKEYRFLGAPFRFRSEPAVPLRWPGEYAPEERKETAGVVARDR